MNIQLYINNHEKKDIHGQPFKDNFNKYEKAGILTPYQLKRFKNFIK